MGRRTTISEKSRIPDVSLGQVVRETLPFPVVSYQEHHRMLATSKSGTTVIGSGYLGSGPTLNGTGNMPSK